MFRSILVPLDGSAFGEHALPLAVRLACGSRASVTLVHVHQLFLAASFAPTPYLHALLDTDRRAQEAAYLEAIQARIRTTPGLRISVELLEPPVVDSLADYIEASDTELVVMTTHGTGGLGRFWLGNVADRLIRHVQVPVLLLRPGEGHPGDEPEHLVKQILIPLDGSPTAEQILPAALTLGALEQAKYTLIAAVEPFLVFDAVSLRHYPDFEHDETRRRMKQAQLYVDGVADRLRLEGRIVRTVVAVDEEPASAILQEAARQPDTIVALATHGRSGIPRLRLGSVADKVIRAASCSVLVFRPAA